MPRILSQFGFLFLSLWSAAQPPVTPAYPAGYFSNPLKIPMKLAANFGELRTNHFHMGLDIRTEGRENLPVYASAPGYIARVKIEPFGFGQVIYINHPNGFTTVYAHLNRFFPALAAYVEKEQYRKESWAVSLDFKPNQFRVRKGDLIAYSGSTGGSEGPHLHFEIRSASGDTNLNPLLFGLPVPDNTRPAFHFLAVYNAGYNVYDQQPRIIPVALRRGRFATGRDTLTIDFPRIGFSIGASDTQTGSNNPNGIYEATLFEDEKPIILFRMDRISYLYTRNINGHIDYRTKESGGPWLQQLFRLPGLEHSVYTPLAGDGILDLSDGALHEIRIDVRDAYGNTSTLLQKLKYIPGRHGGGQSDGRMFYPGVPAMVEREDCIYNIGPHCLYDSAHIAYTKTPSSDSGSVSSVHQIGAAYIPLQDIVEVSIRPDRSLTQQERDRTLVQRRSGNETEIRKAEWRGSWAEGNFTDFGSFQLIVDHTPPVIRLLGGDRNRMTGNLLAFTVKDDRGKLKKVRATVDGHWLNFTNDKAKAFVYHYDEHWPPGNRHRLTVTAEDEAGNIATNTFQIRR